MAYDNSNINRDSNETPAATDDPVRSLYSGDISSSILQKFAAWYRNNKFSALGSIDDSYFCIRSGSSEYKFYVGNISRNGTISQADIVIYRAVNSSGYNSAYEWSVSTVSSGSVDLDGYSGYIYSSYEDYQPNPYMVQYVDSAYAACFTVVLSVSVIFAMIVSGIRRFFNVKGQ